MALELLIGARLQIRQTRNSLRWRHRRGRDQSQRGSVVVAEIAVREEIFLPVSWLFRPPTKTRVALERALPPTPARWFFVESVRFSSFGPIGAHFGCARVNAARRSDGTRPITASRTRPLRRPGRLRGAVMQDVMGGAGHLHGHVTQISMRHICADVPRQPIVLPVRTHSSLACASAR